MRARIPPPIAPNPSERAMTRGSLHNGQTCPERATREVDLSRSKPPGGLLAMVLDEDVRTYFKKYSTEAAPSEHFPLMELPAYDCEEKVRSHDGGTLER